MTVDSFFESTVSFDVCVFLLTWKNQLSLLICSCLFWHVCASFDMCLRTCIYSRQAHDTSRERINCLFWHVCVSFDMCVSLLTCVCELVATQDRRMTRLEKRNSWFFSYQLSLLICVCLFRQKITNRRFWHVCVSFDMCVSLLICFFFGHVCVSFDMFVSLLTRVCHFWHVCVSFDTCVSLVTCVCHTFHKKHISRSSMGLCCWSLLICV